MTDKSTLLRAFNNHFFDFIDDIIRIFPENNELPKSKISFSTIKQANPTAIVKAWYKFIYLKYNNIIQEGDISFFYEKDYSTDIGHLKNADKIMNTIDSLREPIKDMSDTNKGHAMKYIQNLTKLSFMYAEQM
jgi:hypothetical protein